MMRRTNAMIEPVYTMARLLSGNAEMPGGLRYCHEKVGAHFEATDSDAHHLSCTPFLSCVNFVEFGTVEVGHGLAQGSVIAAFD